MVRAPSYRDRCFLFEGGGGGVILLGSGSKQLSDLGLCSLGSIIGDRAIAASKSLVATTTSTQ